MREQERRAYVCRHKDHERIAYRVFLMPGEAVPRCPDHPGTALMRQSNLSYARPDTAGPVGRSQTVKGRRK